MEAKCPCPRCGGRMVRTNGPSFRCTECWKRTFFSMRISLRSGESVELLKVPKGGVKALRMLIRENPAARLATVRHGTITAADIDSTALPLG